MDVVYPEAEPASVLTSASAEDLKDIKAWVNILLQYNTILKTQRLLKISESPFQFLMSIFLHLLTYIAYIAHRAKMNGDFGPAVES